MPKPRRRQFTLADLMILVISSAISLSFLRFTASLGLIQGPDGYGRPAEIYLQSATLGGICILIGPTLAVPILTAWQPRCDRKRDIRGPGFVACMLVLVASVCPVVEFALDMLRNYRSEAHYAEAMYFNYKDFLRTTLLTYTGSTIAGAWLAMALVGRWRPRRTWVDWLGCLVGACWMIFFICNECCYKVVLPLIELR